MSVCELIAYLQGQSQDARVMVYDHTYDDFVDLEPSVTRVREFAGHTVSAAYDGEATETIVRLI
ncbi:hypothetical protein BST32_01700 [Mycobacteroides abscessus subsp. massiliense]|nr:hypothetical protein MMCCUG48898_1673 [Mycobacteroides abscessus subsp. massiliense CCUG 48898 = JCM 15300]ORA92114.1 hypothetical protein BST32_01700 [Mycobacteroides abscessus subsp. massiliense]WJJ56395.1 hypothetical protein PROPHICCUG48898T2_66 [Mycobacterium phage CCUG48898T-2]BAP96626.1 hypothetical protein MMASJCM_1850 [Mycobacteroides abscessus subsp. massiliense CCUG 48898 = JCM 15300]